MRCFPVLVVCDVAAYRTDCCVDRSTAQVAGKLVKEFIEIVFSLIVLGTMHKIFGIYETIILFLNGGKLTPFPIINIDQKGNGFAINCHSTLA